MTRKGDGWAAVAPRLQPASSPTARRAETSRRMPMLLSVLDVWAHALQDEEVHDDGGQAGQGCRADDAARRLAPLREQAEDQRCCDKGQHPTTGVGPAQGDDWRVDVEAGCVGRVEGE